MFAHGSKVFVQFPSNSNQRVLHPFEVEDFGPDALTIRAEEENLPIEPGAEVRVYFEMREKFQQQPARIEAVLKSDPLPLIALALTGVPVSAENREKYRVSTLGTDLLATLDGEDGRLADVNVEGLSVICSRRHGLGAILPVKVFFEGREFSGRASIQSVKDLPKGKFRYGMQCVGDDRHLGGLAHGLHKISTAVQRAQLKRLAAAV